MFEWHERLSEGRESAEDDEQLGCPVMMKTNENVEKVRSLVRTDHCLGTKISEELNMN
jgi:hypothetical protein